jgi:hypothetical protein
MERTISLHYTSFVMEAFFIIADVSEKLGIDMWNYTSPSGKSLKKAFDALRPYISGAKQWEGQQIKPFEYDEAYVLLVEGAEKLGCKSCHQDIRSLAGDKASKLRLNLLY